MVHKIEMTPEERRSVWKAGLGLSTTKVVQPKWKPIETAPKDGSLFLAYYMKHGTHEYSVVNYQESGQLVAWVGENSLLPELYPSKLNPTHWMELPTPPDIIGEQIIREEEEAEIRRELDFEDEFPHGLEGDE